MTKKEMTHKSSKVATKSSKAATKTVFSSVYVIGTCFDMFFLTSDNWKT